MAKKEMIPASVRFDPETHAKLEDMAARERRSFSHQVLYMVDLALQAKSQQQPEAA
jgi:hypothetical protein